jgi:hypothetical protein
MSYPQPLTSPLYVGIFELDTAGTVLYTRQSQPGSSIEKNTYLVGQNFFENVADFENMTDFRRRFKNFVSSHSSTEHFQFECRSIKGSVPVRVLMMRAREKNESNSTEIVIIDIRKNDN